MPDNNPAEVPPAAVPPAVDPAVVPAAPAAPAAVPPVPPAAAPANVVPANLSLDEINAMTGRKYATLEDARKGVAETYRHVGAKEVVPPDAVSRAEFDAALFFRDNTEYNANRTLIDTIAKANGITVQEAVQTPFYKATAEKVKVADDAESARSVLTSSPKLGIVRDASTKALESMENANKSRQAGDVVAAGRYQAEAESAALAAVIGAFGMEKDTIVG